MPTVPAMPPIENNTSAGTPLATQNAPRQSIVRCSSCVVLLSIPVAAVIGCSLIEIVPSTGFAFCKTVPNGKTLDAAGRERLEVPLHGWNGPLALDADDAT